MLSRFLLTFYLFTSTFFTLFAQGRKEYAFTHSGTAAGLLSNEVTALLQDEDGYIWIGTNNGLQRFDGVRYLTFRHDRRNPQSLPQNQITQLIMDKKKNLWVVGTEGKISILDTRKLIFHPVKTTFKKNISNWADKGIVADEYGNVFCMALGYEVITWNEKAREFSYLHNFIPVPENWNFISMAQEPGTHRYWFGSNHGLVISDVTKNQVSYVGHNLAREPMIDQVDSSVHILNMFFDSKRRLWFDRWGPGWPLVNCYDAKIKKFIVQDYSLFPQIMNYFETRGYTEQKDGTIWIRGMGIFGRYLEKEKQFQLVYNGYTNEQSIVYESVSSLYEDKDKNLWVGTSNNGLYRFAPADQYFTNIRHIDRRTNLPGTGAALSFIQTKNNTLLSGTWGEGLYRYDMQLNLLPLNIKGIPERDGPSVWDMRYSKDSNIIWMGAQPGIIRYDQRTNTASQHYPVLFKNQTVRQIVEDRHGNVWAGTNSRGLFKWNTKKENTRIEDGFELFKDIPVSQILYLYEDRAGRIWVAASGHGVFVIDPVTNKVIREVKVVTPDGKLASPHQIVSIRDYDDSTIILGGGLGVYVYDFRKNRIQSIGSPDFLNGVICSVERDEKSGYLWVSTTHGLHRVNVKNKIFVHFDRVDGITDDRFETSSSLILKDGRMIFGADKQFTVFNPDDVKINNTAPKVTITGFKLMNKSLMLDSLLQNDRIDLNSKENSIVIEFSGLSYHSAFLIRYKLEGLDKDWQIADNSNQAVYSYIPPGNYTFLVKSEDADGIESLFTTQLKIRVNPPFWQSWWFFGIIILFAASILYLIDRERIRRLNDLQKVRTEIATNLHEDVTATLSNINLLGEMAKMKADKDIVRSKEYIDQISTKSHNMIIAMDDILWSIDPENDSMHKTLLRMMEYTDSLKNRHGGAIELALDKKVHSIKLDMKTRHELFLIFKEGLKMIVRYAEGRNTYVNIDLFKNRLSMKLQDATAKLDMNISEIELAIKEMNNRATIVGADLDIQYDRSGVAIVLLMKLK